jgi:hypothetical protein
MKNDPVLTYTGLGGLVSAVIMMGFAMAVSLGWVALAPDQMTAIEQFVGAVIGLVVVIAPPIVGAFLARKKVTSIENPRMPDGAPAMLVYRDE